jgi:hypothetical protein
MTSVPDSSPVPDDAAPAERESSAVDDDDSLYGAGPPEPDGLDMDEPANAPAVEYVEPDIDEPEPDPPGWTRK